MGVWSGGNLPGPTRTFHHLPGPTVHLPYGYRGTTVNRGIAESLNRWTGTAECRRMECWSVGVRDWGNRGLMDCWIVGLLLPPPPILPTQPGHTRKGARVPEQLACFHMVASYGNDPGLEHRNVRTTQPLGLVNESQ